MYTVHCISPYVAQRTDHVREDTSRINQSLGTWIGGVGNNCNSTTQKCSVLTFTDSEIGDSYNAIELPECEYICMRTQFKLDFISYAPILDKFPGTHSRSVIIPESHLFLGMVCMF